jgi:hypothetical protein
MQDLKQTIFSLLYERGLSLALDSDLEAIIDAVRSHDEQETKLMRQLHQTVLEMRQTQKEYFRKAQTDRAYGVEHLGKKGGAFGYRSKELIGILKMSKRLETQVDELLGITDSK